MLESNVSVGDTCKEIGVTRHDSDDAVTEQKHNAKFLTVNRNFELSPRQIVCRRLNLGQGTVSRESRLVLRSTEVQPLFYDL